MASIEFLNHLISQSNARVEAECKHDYFHLLHQGVTFKIVVLTMLGLILTIAIECVVNLSSKPMSKTTTESQRPQNSPSEIDAPAPDATDHLAHSTTEPTHIDASDVSPSVEQIKSTKASTTAWCETHPSPSTRARRLTKSTILLIPICLVLGFRIADATSLNIRDECMRYLASSLRPNWWAITILNIVPFIIAIVAWLRALIDCLLARWGKGLRYPAEDFSYLGWPPCAPVLFVIMVGAVPIILFVALLDKGAKWVAGETVAENDDIELGEENRGLIVGMNAEERDVDGPPAYEGLEGVRNEYLGIENEPLAKRSH
jgi:hypothetical protein